MKKVKIAFYDSHSYDRQSFENINEDFGYSIDFFDFKLNGKTALTSKGYDVVCVFVNDVVDSTVISTLKANGVKMIALRCAGFNNVDMEAAQKNGISVARVPAYSPNAVTEHGIALLLSLLRHLPQAYIRTKTGNFTLEGLTGRELNGMTAGILGTGKIGKLMAETLSGFGMGILLYDPYSDQNWANSRGFSYTDLNDLFRKSDVISLHCPLSEQTFHIINEKSIQLMKPDAIILNTGRGALIDSKALVDALKHNKIGGAALDVYEEENKYFYSDWSGNVITDDILARLLTFPNVLITSHQAFLTTNALNNIAKTTLENIKNWSEE